MRDKKRSFTRLVLGDVVEIPVSGGFAYAQYVNRHTKGFAYGDLGRILPGVFKSQLSQADTIEKLVSDPNGYFCFFPIGIAVKRGWVRIIGNLVIPKEYRKIPMFKAYVDNGRTMTRHWYIWDGKSSKSVPVPKLTKEQRKYPMESWVSFDIVVHRIETGWHPEDECDKFVFQPTMPESTWYEGIPFFNNQSPKRPKRKVSAKAKPRPKSSRSSKRK